GFVGRGALIDAELREGEARIGDTAIPVRGAGDGLVQLLIRPEAVRLTDSGLAATVKRVRFMGANYETTLALAADDAIVADLSERLDLGAPAQLAISDAWVVPA